MTRDGARTTLQQLAHPREDCIDHAPGEPSSVRVLAARVVAPDQGSSIRQRVRRPVCKPRARMDPPGVLDAPEVRIERNATERDDHPDARQRVELGVEVRQAVQDFLGRRPVVRGRAPHGGGDERVT